jgi:hypothetical protein
VPVKITDNENKTLSLGPTQQLADINLPIVDLDRSDADSPLGQWLCHSPWHHAGGD